MSGLDREGIVRVARRSLAGGCGGFVVLDGLLHTDARGIVDDVVTSLRGDVHLVFRASADGSRRPFDLVGRALGDEMRRIMSRVGKPVTDRTGTSLLPREITTSFRVVQESLGALARCAAENPVLVVLEELQAADRGSVVFARHLVTYTAMSRIFFVAHFDQRIQTGYLDPFFTGLQWLQE